MALPMSIACHQRPWGRAAKHPQIVEAGFDGTRDHNQSDALGLMLSDPLPQMYSRGGAWGYMEERPGNGLVQMGARWYWPELGRFIQQDPVGDGTNWYAYVGNSPVVRADPEGLKLVYRKGKQEDWDAALARLRLDPGMRDMIRRLEESPIEYHVIANDRCEDTGNPGLLFAHWDPHAALQTPSDGVISPALMLGHELAHLAGGSLAELLLMIKPVPIFDNLDEARVILLHEVPAALNLGEGIRFSHRGTYFHVPSPTSRS